MEGVTLELSLNELPAFIGKMELIADRMADPRPMLEDIARYGEESTRLRFLDEIDPDGRPWEPSLRAKTQGGQTLTDTSRLVKSLTSEATANEAIWGTNTIYAPPHQFGATIKPKNGKYLKFSIPGLGFRTVDEVTIPARPFIGINDDDQDNIAGIAESYLMEGI